MSTLPDDITPERLLKMREERGGPWRPTAEYQESLANNAELTKEAADPRGPLWDTDRKDEAFTWLDRAIDERSSRLLYARVDARLDPLRNDPRFKERLERIEASAAPRSE